MRVLERVTGNKRYMPEPEWAENLHVHNVFRVFEQIFGRKFGVRCENRTAAWYTEDGRLIVSREFYTLESVLVFAECKIREVFAALAPSNWFAPEFMYIQRPAFAAVFLVFFGVEIKLNGSGMLAPVFAGAIAFDAVSSSSANQSTGVTISHTSSGTNRLGVGIMLFGGADPASGFSSRSATWAGSSMTSRVSNTAGNRGIDIFTRTAQSTGAQNVVYSWSGGGTEDRFIQQSYTGVDQTTPTNGTNTAGVTGGTTMSVSVTTTVANSLLVGGFFLREGGVSQTADSPTTDRFNDATNKATGDRATTTTGAYTLSWTVGSGGIGTNSIIGAIALSPVASTDVTATPSVLAATFSTQAPALSGTANVSPSVLSAVFSAPARTVSGGATVAPNVLAATFSIPTVNIITPDAQVLASVLSATFSVPSATISAGALTTPNVLSATFSQPSATFRGDFTALPSVLAATFSIPAPTVIAIGNITVSPSVLSATFSLPSPTVSAEQNAAIAAGVLSATFSVQAPTVEAIQNVTLTATTLVATFSVNTPRRVGGLWVPQPRVNGDAAWTPQPRVI